MRYLLIPSILALISASSMPTLNAAEAGGDGARPDRPPQQRDGGEQQGKDRGGRQGGSQRGKRSPMTPEDLSEIFAILDANSDGLVDDSEFSKLMDAQKEFNQKKGLEMLKENNPEQFAKIDSDGNGEISDQEMADHKDARLAEMTEKIKEKNLI